MNATRTMLLLYFTILFFNNIKSMDQHQKDVILAGGGISKSSSTSSFQPIQEEINTCTPDTIPTNLQVSPDERTGSWFGITAYYGLAKAAGKTKAQVFFELNRNKTLQADVKKNPAEVIRRLTEATEERFKEKNLVDPSNQHKIFQIIQISQGLKNDSGKDIQVPKVLAQEYNAMQKEALIKIIQEHATNKQPAFARARDVIIAQSYAKYNEELIRIQKIKQDEIAQANLTYRDNMEKLRIFESHAACNSRYVHGCSQDLEVFPLHDSRNYTDLYSQTANYKNVRYQLKVQDPTADTTKKEPKNSLQESLCRKNHTKAVRKQNAEQEIFKRLLTKFRQEKQDQKAAAEIAQRISGTTHP